MGLKKLMQLYSVRREKLIGLMKDKDVKLSRKRKYEISGAIAEIDLFLMNLESEYEHFLKEQGSSEVFQMRRGL